MSRRSGKRGSRRSTRAPTRRSSRAWLLVAAALVVVGGGLAIVSQRAGPGTPGPTPVVTGAPRLAVDRTTIDEGVVKFGTPIKTTFQLRNVGDQPLQILGEPQVAAVTGC